MNPRNVFIGVIVVVLALMLLRANKLARPLNPYRLILPTLTAEELYPRPTELPPPTERPLSELLAEYESELESLSPAAHAALRPGLSEDELNRLEAEYSIVLSSDMRALYTWRNGSDAARNVYVFPYMHFFPLNDALAERDHLRKSSKHKSPHVRELAEEWASHRYPWVGITYDGAGNGCFYDPERRDEASCFFSFYDGEYVFYPTIGNYIEELLERHRLQQLSGDERGVTVNSDWTYDQEMAFQKRFGRWVEQFGP